MRVITGGDGEEQEDPARQEGRLRLEGRRGKPPEDRSRLYVELTRTDEDLVHPDRACACAIVRSTSISLAISG